MRGDAEKIKPAVNPNIKLPIEMYLIDGINSNLTGKKGLECFDSILKKNTDMTKVKMAIKFFTINDRFILLE